MSSHNTDIVQSVVRECELSSCTSPRHHFNRLRWDYTDIVEVKRSTLWPLQCNYHPFAFIDFGENFKVDTNAYKFAMTLSFCRLDLHSRSRDKSHKTPHYNNYHYYQVCRAATFVVVNLLL